MPGTDARTNSSTEQTEAVLANGGLQGWVDIWVDNASDTMKKAAAQGKVRLAERKLSGQAEALDFPESVARKVSESLQRSE